MARSNHLLFVVLTARHMIFFLCPSIYIHSFMEGCECGHMHTCACHNACVEVRTTCESQFLPPHVWDPGTELRS